MKDINGKMTFLETISASELPDLIKEYSEIAIDLTIENNTLEKFPVVSSFFGVFSIAKTAKDFLFVKKLSKFLDELYKIKKQDRNRLVEKIKKDDKYSTKIGEKVFYLLDKADDNEKPSLMAKVFKIYVEEKISFEELHRMIAGIDKLLIMNKEYLKLIANGNKEEIKKIPYYVIHNLGDAGFIKIITGWDDLISDINDIGKKFVENVLV